jgi:dTDP-L-rhamnose 4-epimerase
MSIVLVTGGAGFIGSHFVPMALTSGSRVRVIDSLSPQVHGKNPLYSPPTSVEFIKGDVANRADIATALEGVDAIVHLAAETGTGQSMYEIDRYYRVNVQATALLFDILANKPHRVKKIVLASSRSVYGEGAYICAECEPKGKRVYPGGRTKDQLAARAWEPTCPECGETVSAVATCEGDNLSPSSIYAASKRAQEDLVRIGCSSQGISQATLRFQNVYGEGQSLDNPYTGILSIFSTRIRLGMPIPIFEDGCETRDFVHVEDVSRAILACVNSESFSGGIINVGSGEATSIMHVSRLLCQIMGSEIEPHVSEQFRVGDIRHNFADISRLRSILGISPGVTLYQGLERFCAWVKTQPIPQDLLDKANAELASRKMMG